MKKNDIDKMLQSWWAERREHDDIEALHRRISRAVEVEDQKEPTAVPQASTSWFPRIGYALAGAAAMAVLLLCGGWFQGRLNKTDEGGFLAMAQIPARELAAGARVFDETALLFEDRLKWIAESNGDVGMGIDSNPDASVDDAVPAFVRVMVLVRAEGDENWREVWKADVIVRGQEMARIETNGEGKNQLMLWVYPMDDGRLMVDTSVNLEGKVNLASEESSIMANGKPAQIASIKQDHIEYRVLQTVKMLSGSGGQDEV